ncbi:hypothetical protein BDV40DRAFT_179327 [Aspergillus tamarii]|uniref:Uncharacterized protein n=1 Tax=Aspergillus tamarii TaxID=41984 RepID=A0A5N6USJ2_ASPTM|nr:hypothetical protein BDV40DRAFT_179327 [Aspergillus tamarii]
MTCGAARHRVLISSTHNEGLVLSLLLAFSGQQLPLARYISQQFQAPWPRCRENPRDEAQPRALGQGQHVICHNQDSRSSSGVMSGEAGMTAHDT